MSPLRRLITLGCAGLFGAILIFLSPGKMLLAVGGTGLALSIFRQPRLGLLLFAFFATAVPFSTVQLGIRITLSEAMLAFACLGTGWHLILGRKTWSPGLTERRLLRLMGFSVLPFVVGQLTVLAEGNGPVNWLRWLLNLTPIFLVPILLDDEEAQDQLIVALLLGSLLLLLVSIGYFLQYRSALAFIPVLQKLNYAHPEWIRDNFSSGYARMASPWVHPNLTGGALVLMLPLAFFYAQARRGWRRLLGAAVALLGAAGLLFSISRGAIVSLGVILLWLNWRRAPFAGRILGLAMVMGIALILFYPPLQDRLATTFSATNASTEVRLDEYRRFPRAMARFPLGTGFKTDLPPPNTGLLGISNLWLNVIYKLGLAGLALFALVISAWWKESRPRGWFDHLDGQQSIALGSSAGLLAALVTGLFDHYYSFTVVLIALFWLVMGLNLQLARGRTLLAGPTSAMPPLV